MPKNGRMIPWNKWFQLWNQRIILRNFDKRCKLMTGVPDPMTGVHRIS